MPSISLSIKNELESVRLVGRAARICCTGILEPDDCHLAELCVVEAVNNTIEHAYKGEEEKTVWVNVHVDDEKVVFEVIDEGAQIPENNLNNDVGVFDYDPEDIDALPEGGLGLALIYESMADVVYTSIEGRNTLKMALFAPTGENF